MPLSREAVHKLADAKGFDADDVYGMSGGIPFYVNEIVASYSPGIPENIKDSILSVFEQQEDGTKNAWQLFSVIRTAIEYAQDADADKLVALYEAYAPECYLTNQIANATLYQEKALTIWQNKGETEKMETLPPSFQILVDCRKRG